MNKMNGSLLKHPNPFFELFCINTGKNSVYAHAHTDIADR